MSNNSGSCIVPTSESLCRPHGAQKDSGVDIHFKDIHYSVEVEDPNDANCLPCNKATVIRHLLTGVTGSFRAGEVTAIMGTSGSGKTTLLNAVACRLPQKSLSGRIYANDCLYGYEDFGYFGGYVMQNDILMHTLTVRQTFEFAADMKINCSTEEKQKKVLDLCQALQLVKCMDTVVGNAVIKGISGGEKKRTSIGFQLISNPSVLILDEPTSGLDSFTAYILIKYLKDLAVRENKTLIMTIHQPSTSIFKLLDKLILMIEGRFIYQGPSSQVINYFWKEFGLLCPQFNNPPCYLISVMHPGSTKNSRRYPNYYETYQRMLAPLNDFKQPVEDKHSESVQSEVSFVVIMKALFKRDLINGLRNPKILVSRFFQSIIISIFTGALYCRFSGEYTSTQNWKAVSGFYFFVSIGFVFLELTPVSLVFPLQRAVFLKEQSAKLYGTLPYFLSRSVIDLPCSLIFPLIIQLILYWFINLSSTVTQFFTFYLISFLLSFAGNSLGLVIGSVIKDARTADRLSTYILSPMFLFSGFFKNRENLPVWIGWIEFLSPIKYGLSAYLQNEVRYASSSNVGDFNFGLSIWESRGLLAALGVAFRLLSLFLLWMLRTKLE